MLRSALSSARESRANKLALDIGSRATSPWVLLVFFLLLFLIGIALDEPARVLEQARSICLECIGIG